MEKNKYSKNLNKYEQMYFLVVDYAKEYSKFLEDKDNRTNENRCERYYKKVYDFVKQELDKARKEVQFTKEELELIMMILEDNYTTSTEYPSGRLYEKLSKLLKQ